MNHEAKLKALLAEAAELQKKSELSDEDETRLSALPAEIIAAKAAVDHDHEVADQLAEALKAAATDAPKVPGPGLPEHVMGGGARTLGAHFVESLGEDGMKRLASRMPVEAPAFKANTDTQTVPGVFAPILTDIDTNLVTGYRRPTVTDLFSTGSLSGDRITYFVEQGVDGDFSTVAEAAQKGQIHFQDPTSVTENLHKIAAWWAVSDEMASDTAFWRSEIDNRGLYMLGLFEEQQILFGNGVGENLKGVLVRDGIQAKPLVATSTPVDIFKALFAASTDILTATGLSADGVLINPADYQSLRMWQDNNGQFVGGGPFGGQYGVGPAATNPPLWGFATRVSAAIPKGTIAVGAFKSSVTVYRKGGIVTKVDPYTLMTQNLLRTVLEERVGLSVPRPSAIVKINIAQA